MQAHGARPVIVCGFRVHLGWANAVTISVSGDDLVFVDRRDLDLGTGGASHGFGPDLRIEEARAAMELAITDALVEFTTELDVDRGGVVVTREGILRIPMEKLLASSSLYHTAAGALYQQSLRAAFENLGLPCAAIRFDEAEALISADEVATIGQQAGRPWRKDHRFASVAALHAAGTNWRQ